MTAPPVARVLDALVEQEAVQYAAVTSPGGKVVAEAGDLPRDPADEAPEATVHGTAGDAAPSVRSLAEVGEGKILHVGTSRRLPGPELRQLQSVVASAM